MNIRHNPNIVYSDRHCPIKSPSCGTPPKYFSDAIHDVLLYACAKKYKPSLKHKLIPD